MMRMMMTMTMMMMMMLMMMMRMRMMRMMSEKERFLHSRGSSLPFCPVIPTMTTSVGFAAHSM